MIIMKLVAKVRKFVRENMDELNMEHTERVRRIALKLAKKENADKEVVEIAALLHDIAKPRGHVMDHHTKGVEIAREMLEGVGADQDLVKKALHCIETHMMKCDLPDAPRPDTAEARVVFDADMINLISPFGISISFVQL